MSADVDDYDEFGMLGDNAAEAGLPLSTLPSVRRMSFTLAHGQTVSALAWGDAQPELVLLHGGGQNAHTWDTVALALGRPLLAIDLPGHGHSARRGDRDYGPWRNAEAVASVIEQAAPAAKGVVGMSLGGATAIRLAATRPDLVRRAVIVDVTPNSGVRSRTMAPAERGAVALVSGPPTYESFAAMAASPTSRVAWMASASALVAWRAASPAHSISIRARAAKASRASSCVSTPPGTAACATKSVVATV